MRLAERLRRQLAETDSHVPRWRGDDVIVAENALVPAAVLIAVTDRKDPGVLLTLRNSQLRNHAGQVAFPGGRIDPGDDGAVGAALREAEEEIGLPADQVDVIGLSDSYRTGTGYMITPVIAVVRPDLELNPQADEVEAIFEPPLAQLLDSSNYVEREAEWQGRQRRFREMMWNEYRIWGATASMLANLAIRIGPWR